MSLQVPDASCSDLNGHKGMRAPANWQAGHQQHHFLFWCSLRYQFPCVLSHCFKLSTWLQDFLNYGPGMNRFAAEVTRADSKGGTNLSALHLYPCFSLPSLCSIQAFAAQTCYTLLLICFWVFKPPLPVASNIMQFTIVLMVKEEKHSFPIANKHLNTMHKTQNWANLLKEQICQQQVLIKIFSSINQP